MSGVDEQNKVPQCPMCGTSHEIRVGSETWLFPEDARIKRELKYSLYTRRYNAVPQFYSDEIQCLSCGAKYANDTVYYDRLKHLFNRCVRRKEYYDNEAAFEDGDNPEGWDYGDDDLSEVVWNV